MQNQIKKIPLVSYPINKFLKKFVLKTALNLQIHMKNKKDKQMDNCIKMVNLKLNLLQSINKTNNLIVNS